MSTTKIDSDKLRRLLRGFYGGTDQWYRHGLNRNVLYTDGVQAFAENAGAYWFLDIVATELHGLQKREHALFISLDVRDSAATIRVTDGNTTTLYTRAIEWTDCPEGDWTFYFIDGVIMLPCEY